LAKTVERSSEVLFVYPEEAEEVLPVVIAGVENWEKSRNSLIF
jgi:hypothetical protein